MRYRGAGDGGEGREGRREGGREGGRVEVRGIRQALVSARAYGLV